MIKELIQMDNQNIDALLKADKALAVLSDLSEDYGFEGEAPTMEEAMKLSFEAIRIANYISIALDYVSGIKNVLKKSAEDLDTLINEAKHMEGERANG